MGCRFFLLGALNGTETSREDAGWLLWLTPHASRRQALVQVSEVEPKFEGARLVHMHRKAHVERAAPPRKTPRTLERRRGSGNPMGRYVVEGPAPQGVGRTSRDR